jgi:hypothetical protein
MIGRRWKEDPLTYQEALEKAQNKCPLKSGEDVAIAILWSRENRCKRWRNKFANIFMEIWLKTCMHRNGKSFYTTDGFAARVVEKVFLLIAERTSKEEKYEQV